MTTEPNRGLPKAPPLNAAETIKRPAKRSHPMRYLVPLAGVALFIVGINGSFWLGVLGFLIVMFSIAMALNRREDAALRTAAHGAVRVVTVKQQWVNQKVQQYAQAGWHLDAQSSAKSLGSQARVTLTFRKP